MSFTIDPMRLTATNIIPENAPFSADQRAWLSGFLAAVIAQPPVAAAPVTVPATPSNEASNDDAPWHDPAMAIDARMDLAQGRPIAPRLMAAMAQQDCGQCGYTCAAYANVLAKGTEQRLNLCAPGGKDTARMLKVLAGEIGGRAPNVAAEVVAPTVAAERGYAREAPVAARFLGRRRLNGDGSAKDTWHIDLDLDGTGIDYRVGDSLGIVPANDVGLVDQIIAMLGVARDRSARQNPARGAAQRHVAVAGPRCPVRTSRVPVRWQAA